MHQVAGHRISRHAADRMAERAVSAAEVEGVLALGTITRSGGVKYYSCRRVDLVDVPEKTARRLARLIVVTNHDRPGKVVSVYTAPNPWGWIKEQLKKQR